MDKEITVIKSDRWIKDMAERGMISPFEPAMIRGVPLEAETIFREKPMRKVISYGTSSYGYDLRLSPNDFRIFRHIPGEVVNPKAFNPDFLEPAKLHCDQCGDYFIIPANSYALGVALERLEIPNNIIVVCVGKSTYARAGVIANITPAEPRWCGHLTLEFSNASSADVMVFANEGIVQLLFLQGEPCETSYADRNGKYQNQSEHVTLPKL